MHKNLVSHMRINFHIFTYAYQRKANNLTTYTNLCMYMLCSHVGRANRMHTLLHSFHMAALL